MSLTAPQTSVEDKIHPQFMETEAMHSGVKIIETKQAGSWGCTPQPYLDFLNSTN